MSRRTAQRIRLCAYSIRLVSGADVLITPPYNPTCVEAALKKPKTEAARAVSASGAEESSHPLPAQHSDRWAKVRNPNLVSQIL